MPAGAPSAAKAAAAIDVSLPGFAMRCVGAAIFGLIRPLMRLLFGVKVAGLEHLSGDEPLVIVPNHASYLDPLALAAALPWRRLRKTFWAGWVGVLYTGPITRFVSRAAQVMPVDPDRDIASAIGTARTLLQRGYSIVWFPEGRRSPTGEVGPFFGGIGQLAARHESGRAADRDPRHVRRTAQAAPLAALLASRRNVRRAADFARASCRRPRGANISGRLEREVRALVTSQTEKA